MMRPANVSGVRSLLSDPCLPVVVFCLLALVLWITGCARRETPVEAGIREQVLHLGNSDEPRDLDLHVVVSFNDFNIVLALF